MTCQNKQPHNQDKAIVQDHMPKQTPTQSRQNNNKRTCQNKHPHNQDKTILQEHMSKQTPTQSRQNNITRWHDKPNTHTIKTKQYYKMTCQNKHPYNQDKTILQEHMSKQTPTQSRQNNITRSLQNTHTIKTKWY